jgi:hypothetical protein
MVARILLRITYFRTRMKITQATFEVTPGPNAMVIKMVQSS